MSRTVKLEFCKSDLLGSVKPSRGVSNPVAYVEMMVLINPRGWNEVPEKDAQIDSVSNTQLQGVA